MTAIFGLLSGFALIFIAMSIGGSPAAYVNAAGLLIVLAGTAAVTAISFSLTELSEAPRTLWRLFSQPSDDPTLAALEVIQLAERNRPKSLLELEEEIPNQSDQPLFANALQLLVDGSQSDEVENLVNREAGTIASRNLKSVDILRRAGEVAPAMGLIGTLLGLVRMLQMLDDPSQIGPAMAVALLTTFYGAILAHMVFIPLAARADRLTEEESLVNSVYALGAASIGRKENPRKLEILINTILPPAKKVSYFD